MPFEAHTHTHLLRQGHAVAGAASRRRHCVRLQRPHRARPPIPNTAAATATTTAAADTIADATAALADPAAELAVVVAAAGEELAVSGDEGGVEGAAGQLHDVSARQRLRRDGPMCLGKHRKQTAPELLMDMAHGNTHVSGMHVRRLVTAGGKTIGIRARRQAPICQAKPFCDENSRRATAVIFSTATCRTSGSEKLTSTGVGT